MQSSAKSPNQYLDELPEDRKPAMNKLRDLILANLPNGFEEQMSYGMLGYVVPKSIYPAGYHCTPELPLPFINLASQKNFIAFYHMALYGNKPLHDWFTAEYEKTGWKLDMGKACVRFKNLQKIPFELIGELCRKVSLEDYIKYYEQNFKK